MIKFSFALRWKYDYWPVIRSFLILVTLIGIAAWLWP